MKVTVGKVDGKWAVLVDGTPKVTDIQTRNNARETAKAIKAGTLKLEPELTPEAEAAIAEGQADHAAGRTSTLDEVKEEVNGDNEPDLPVKGPYRLRSLGEQGWLKRDQSKPPRNTARFRVMPVDRASLYSTLTWARKKQAEALRLQNLRSEVVLVQQMEADA